ncbi:MAG: NUDIX hydrolase [Cyanobacteria bacterium J06649_4]
MGAGGLFFDSEGRLLILKPTYRNDWLIPGGVVEANESPRHACMREVRHPRQSRWLDKCDRLKGGCPTESL